MTTGAVPATRRLADPAVPLLLLAGTGLAAAWLGADVLTWAALGGLAGHALSGSV